MTTNRHHKKKQKQQSVTNSYVIPILHHD